ncbi:MAG: SPFH domain-containing protein [Candidatus Obscuribacterales bacterium]|nr:SPFH domain-containing protein [Candidatus Obscuribacterales bacterium]
MELISIALTVAGYLVAILFVVGIFFGTFFKVSTSSVKIVERFGKYHRTAREGLNIKIPLIDAVRKEVSMQVQQHVVNVDTITKDKVSVRVSVAVNYEVMDGNEHTAFYKLSDPKGQIDSFVFDVVRSQVPKQTLDEAFDSKDTIAQAVNTELTNDMATFGYRIVKALVTEIEPDAKVKAAMNNINAAQRERDAANAQGEAEKTMAVKRAEAQKEADKLRGEGIAAQRLAIINGMKDSAEQLKQAYPGVGEETILSMIMMTQYLETLEKVGAKSGTTTLFVPSTAGGFGDMRQQMMEALAVNASAGAKTKG